MKSICFALRSLLVVFALTTTAFAQNIFRNLDSTVGGYPTWDADMINLEAVSQTGRGVYVAVLDTGMVPNWRDYFPDARVATNLGTGFHQPVTFKAKKNTCGLEVEVGTLRSDTWVGSRGSTHGTHVASIAAGATGGAAHDRAGPPARLQPAAGAAQGGQVPQPGAIEIRVRGRDRPRPPACARRRP